MNSTTEPSDIDNIGISLNNPKLPLNERFRALFTLRNIGGSKAVEWISRCFSDSSALLKHELAYCLGQLQNDHAIPILLDVLGDTSHEPMVRHEAGEALGAIGSKEVLEILKDYSTDPVVEVAETCQLAYQRIQWLHSEQEENLPDNPYSSVDPTPPCPVDDVEALRKRLLDEDVSLFDRYRAMFALRNTGSEECVLALAEGLKCQSALFRHEVAYVLGQMQNPAGMDQLSQNLRDVNENPMVRHECAEALGAIATDECKDILFRYLGDSERVVKESCLVALDMADYENSNQFQYADYLSKINATDSEKESLSIIK